MGGRDPIVAPRAATAQPNQASTRKDQKRYQISDPPEAKEINDEFDRVHTRLNQIVVAAAALADLDPATATAAQCATRLNELAEILRDSGLLLRA